MSTTVKQQPTFDILQPVSNQNKPPKYEIEVEVGSSTVEQPSLIEPVVEKRFREKLIRYKDKFCVNFY